MVEATANSIEDFLVDGLSYKLKKGASYVNSRRSVTYHPSGSNIYSTNGTKLIKIVVSGDDWLDPNTFRVMFDLQNMESTEAKRLRPLGGPHAFFKRMRVLCNGQIVEDIDDYNRIHEMFNVLSSPEVRKNAEAEGFGNAWDIENWRTNKMNTLNFQGIKGGQSRTVLFKPLSGLLMQPKYLPLRYCPVTIELELVSDAETPILSKLTADDAGTTGDVNVFTPSKSSLKWQIQNVQVKCDVCSLDNSLDNSYAEHLLSGKALPINYNTYISQFQNLLSGANGQQKVRLNVTRALSRLKSVFVTLDKPVYNEAILIGRKSWNDFYSPMQDYGKNFSDTNTNSSNPYDQNGEFQFQLALGSKLYPEFPMNGHGEAFYQLRKTMGAASNNVHGFDIDALEYRDYKFIIGVDTEKVLEAGFTGMNTKAGDILNLRFDHNDSTVTNYAHSMHIVLVSDNILEIRDGGVSVFG